MKRILLDTSVLIYREAPDQINEGTSEFFKLVDHFQYRKCVHPLTCSEIERYKGVHKEFFKTKISSYDILSESAPEAESIRLMKAQEPEKHHIDSSLLNEVVQGTVDYFITEDLGMNDKAGSLGISDKVFSTYEFLRDVLRPSLEGENRYFQDDERVVRDEVSYQYYRSTPLVYLHAYLPDGSDRRDLTCLIDVRGVNSHRMTFSNKEIVSVLFSGAVSSRNERFRKWIVGDEINNGYSVQLGNCRFSFSTKVVNDLCKVIDDFYSEFISYLSENGSIAELSVDYSKCDALQLLEICRDLQTFFSGYHNEKFVYIESELISHVFLALKYLVESCQNLDKVYLMRNLSTSRFGSDGDILRLLDHEIYRQHHPNNIALLDYTFRSFIALVEDNEKTLNAEDCRKILKWISPVLQKVRVAKMHLNYLKLLNEES